VQQGPHFTHHRGWPNHLLLRGVSEVVIHKQGLANLRNSAISTILGD
jgi:hypothetical protein